LAPSANPYAQQQPQPIFDPYAEAERQREVEKAAAERLREAEVIRRRAEFIRLRDEMRSVAFDQYGTQAMRHSKVKSPSYCSLNEIRSSHKRRGLLDRFDYLVTRRGYDQANLLWRKRGEHVSFRTPVPDVLISDMYTLTMDIDEPLVRWYSERVLEYQYGCLDVSLNESAPSRELLAPGHLMLPCWWTRKRFPGEWQTEYRRRVVPAGYRSDTPVVVLWADIELTEMPKSERPHWYLPVQEWHCIPPKGLNVPSPKVMMYLSSYMFDDTPLSRFLWAVAHTEWTAYYAATWIEQAIALKRLYHLPVGVIEDFRKLGLSAPLRINPKARDWDDPFDVTPTVYQQLLDLHDLIRWADYPVIQFPGTPLDKESNSRWLPLERVPISIEWNSPWLGITENTHVLKTVLMSTAARPIIEKWTHDKFRLKDVIQACMQSAAVGREMAPLGDENMAREREEVAIQLANLQRELDVLCQEKDAIVTQCDESDALYQRTLDLLKKRDVELEAVAAESSHHQKDALQMASSMDDLQKQIASLKAEKEAHDSRLQKEFTRYTSLQESVSLLHDTLANLAQTTKASADTAATSLRLLEQTKPAPIQFKPSGSGVGTYSCSCG